MPTLPTPVDMSLILRALVRYHSDVVAGHNLHPDGSSPEDRAATLADIDRMIDWAIDAMDESFDRIRQSA